MHASENANKNKCTAIKMLTSEQMHTHKIFILEQILINENVNQNQIPAYTNFYFRTNTCT